MTHVVGMMWLKNEGDIIEEIIADALKKVDSLFVYDDGSTDRSWDIVKSFGSRLEYATTKSLAIPRELNIIPHLWGRNHLLAQIKKRYKPEDTWVQIIEGDMMLLDTDVRQAIKDHACNDIAVFWQTLNAVRPNWEGRDEYPHWSEPITKVMSHGHWIELMLYTFRPLPGIEYEEGDGKPWPRGFSAYNLKERKRKKVDSPLLAHYGYRGPTHFMDKYYKGLKKTHPKYHDWHINSPEAILKTVPFFNGLWNRSVDTFEMSREGWTQWLTGRS